MWASVLAQSVDLEALFVRDATENYTELCIDFRIPPPPRASTARSGRHMVRQVSPAWTCRACLPSMCFATGPQKRVALQSRMLLGPGTTHINREWPWCPIFGHFCRFHRRSGNCYLLPLGGRLCRLVAARRYLYPHARLRRSGVEMQNRAVLHETRSTMGEPGDSDI